MSSSGHVHCNLIVLQNSTVVFSGHIYGEGHLVTFDGARYNFNGKGYYVLSTLKTKRTEMMVQVRMEQPPKNLCMFFL